MFSGIVQGMGKVTGVEHRTDFLHLTLDLGSLAENLLHGSSVAVAGVCLTAVDIKGTYVDFDVMHETLQKTTLGSLKINDLVNVERSVRFGDEIGGHYVFGHVVGTAVIRAIERTARNCMMTFGCKAEWLECILPKGFVALDGCSLTVVETGDGFFTVHLIPETLRATTFGCKKEGDAVNLELDAFTQTIAETIKRLCTRTNSLL